MTHTDFKDQVSQVSALQFLAGGNSHVHLKHALVALPSLR